MEEVDLTLIKPRDYESKLVKPEQILAWLFAANAYWEYVGDPVPEKPHTQMSTGYCCGEFFLLSHLLKYPNIVEILGRQAAYRLLSLMRPAPDTWVISSAYSAITFGHEVAKALNLVCGNTEKDPVYHARQLWWKQTIPAKAPILQAEEVIATTGTYQAVLRAIQSGNREKPVTHYSPILAIVYRPPKMTVAEEEGEILPITKDNRPVVALVRKAVPIFLRSECPYCRVGSKSLSPDLHWKELTGRD